MNIWSVRCLLKRLFTKGKPPILRRRLDSAFLGLLSVPEFLRSGTIPQVFLWFSLLIKEKPPTGEGRLNLVYLSLVSVPEFLRD